MLRQKQQPMMLGGVHLIMNLWDIAAASIKRESAEAVKDVSLMVYSTTTT